MLRISSNLPTAPSALVPCHGVTETRNLLLEHVIKIELFKMTENRNKPRKNSSWSNSSTCSANNCWPRFPSLGPRQHHFNQNKLFHYRMQYFSHNTRYVALALHLLPTEMLLVVLSPQDPSTVPAHGLVTAQPRPAPAQGQIPPHISWACSAPSWWQFYILSLFVHTQKRLFLSPVLKTSCFLIQKVVGSGRQKEAPCHPPSQPRGINRKTSWHL